MSKRRAKKSVEELYDGCVSANECTGLYQHISLDKDEIAKFHREYIEEDK